MACWPPVPNRCRLRARSVHTSGGPVVQTSLVRPATESQSFVALLRQRAVEQPNRTILTHLLDDAQVGGSLTYGALDRRARAIAVSLLERVRPGDRCLLLH